MQRLDVLSVRFSCDRTCCPFIEECRFQPMFRALGRTLTYSHVVKIEVEVRDLDALERAAQSLGLQLCRGQRKYAWFGEYMGDTALPAGVTPAQLGKCDHALHLNSEAYEIGVVDNHDGTFGLLWDFFCGGYGLQDAVGEGCSKLIARYGVEVARSSATAQGWYCEDQTDGSLMVYHPTGGTMTVSPQGQVEAAGFVGQGCHSPVELLAAAMGRKVDSANTNAYFAEKAKIVARE